MVGIVIGALVVIALAPVWGPALIHIAMNADDKKPRGRNH